MTRTILLVEDNPMDVDLTVRVLRRSTPAVHVEVARDGEEALAWLERWRTGTALPILILLDLKLPRVDGLEVLREYKRDQHAGTIPVVVLTTSAEAADVRTAYALGANSYLVKPVEFEEFMALAARVQQYWTVDNRLPF